jgi:ribosomal protein L24E
MAKYIPYDELTFTSPKVTSSFNYKRVPRKLKKSTLKYFQEVDIP